MSSIMGWGPSWAPRAWALCAGQLLAISSNTALFSLLGTTYGGDGRTTFALPDLRGRVPIAAGQSPGTSHYPLGARTGSESVTLTQLEMPVHSHSAMVTGGTLTDVHATENTASNATASAGQQLATGDAGGRPVNMYANAGGTQVRLGGVTNGTGQITIGNAGGNLPFSVLQPLLAIQFIICIQGIFPSRN